MGCDSGWGSDPKEVLAKIERDVETLPYGDHSSVRKAIFQLRDRLEAIEKRLDQLET